LQATADDSKSDTEVAGRGVGDGLPSDSPFSCLLCPKQMDSLLRESSKQRSIGVAMQTIADGQHTG
jgi:hypothetical protein